MGIYAGNKDQAVHLLTKVMPQVTKWLSDSYLPLNLKKNTFNVLHRTTNLGLRREALFA